MKLPAVSGFKREVLGCVVLFHLLERGVLWDLVARVGFCFGVQNESTCSGSVRGGNLTWVRLPPVSGFKRREQGCNETSLPDGVPLTAFLFSKVAIFQNFEILRFLEVLQF